MAYVRSRTRRPWRRLSGATRQPVAGDAGYNPEPPYRVQPAGHPCAMQLRHSRTGSAPARGKVRTRLLKAFPDHLDGFVAALFVPKRVCMTRR
jgi:hypothetical protein